jgi:hypothetical protein
MGLETGTYLDDLLNTNPLGTDQKLQGDDHIRLIKTLLGNTFPFANRAFRFETSESSASGVINVVATDDKKIFRVAVGAAARTVNLPLGSAVFAGFYVQIVPTGTENDITVNRAGSDTIGASRTSYVITAPAPELRFTWTGASWEISAVGIGTPRVVLGTGGSADRGYFEIPYDTTNSILCNFGFPSSVEENAQSSYLFNKAYAADADVWFSGGARRSSSGTEAPDWVFHSDRELMVVKNNSASPHPFTWWAVGKGVL